jgi:hypothetical protein
VVADLLAAGNYKAAYRRVESFQRDISPPGERNPVSLELAQRAASIRRASLESWRALERGLRQGNAPTLEAWVERFAEHERRAGEGFVEEPEVLEGIQRAKRLHAQARDVRAAVQVHEHGFAPEPLQERLERGEAGRLLAEDLPRSERALEDAVARLWTGDALDVTPLADLLGERGLVRLRIASLATRVREQVDAYARGVLGAAEAARREGRLGDAEAALSDLQHRLWLMGERALYQRALTALEQVQVERRKREQARDAALAVVVSQVLAALQRLDATTPAALGAAVRVSPEQRHALGEGLAEVEALVPLAAAVERLYDGAMAGLTALQAARKRLPARPRGLPPAERPWLLAGVDPAARAFEVSSGGSAGREPRRRSLFDLEPAQIVELARSAPGPAPDRLALALGAVALLPAPEAAREGDAWALTEAYDAALDALGAAEAAPLLLRSLRAARVELERDARTREATASGYHDRGRIYVSQGKFGDAYFFVNALRREARLKGTRYAAEKAAEIRDLLAVIEQNIEEGSMERVLPGVRARRVGKGEVWELTYDWDTDLQVGPQNFSEGHGVLEPVEGPVITPDPTRLQQRLHLLRGFEEPVKDLPLTWPSIFDPAEPITVELTVFAPERPFVLAIDVDGLTVAVLSLDPRWLPQFRLPPTLPLLEGEKRLPEVDGMGRGRGVAFHEGPDFGDLQAWKAPGGGSAWPQAGRGLRLVAESPPRLPAQDLFGFPPRGPLAPTSWRVKVVREWKRLSLYVDDRLIASEEREEWGRRGMHSERQPRMGNGTGAIRILTWTPLAIDDLKLTGTVRSAWLEAHRPEAGKPAAEPAPGKPR